MRILWPIACFFCVVAPAQNLLQWDRWQAWNAHQVFSFGASPEWISLTPYSPTSGQCGFEQIVSIPQAGYYQFHFDGAGGLTGWFSAGWTIGPNQRGFSSERRQFSWTVGLSAGTHLVRFTTSTSNLTADFWIMRQPILRPVVVPTVEVSLVEPPMPTWSISTAGHLLLLANQRLSPPLPITGIGYGLELDPGSGLMLLGFSPTGNISLGGLAPFSSSLGPFYLQAVDLNHPASFGSRLYVSAFRF